MSKVCKKCGLKKPLKDFYRSSRGVKGRQTCCIPCHLENSVQWRKQNPVKALAHCKKWRKENAAHVSKNKQEWRLRKCYGLTERDYQDLLRKQNGVCAICKTKPDAQRLFVDHCHSTKKVRGLLCHFCNIGIGNLKDNPERLRAAATYLEEQR